jgi:hypothetical protein
MNVPDRVRVLIREMEQFDIAVREMDRLELDAVICRLDAAAVDRLGQRWADEVDEDEYREAVRQGLDQLPTRIRQKRNR